MSKLRCCLSCGRDTRNKSQICTQCNKERRESPTEAEGPSGVCWWLDEEDDVDVNTIDVEWLIDESE